MKSPKIHTVLAVSTREAIEQNVGGMAQDARTRDN